MPAIRPIQLSALKTLDPLDQQPQRGEDDNDQADIEHVGHGPSSDCHNPGAIPGISGDHAVLTGKWGASAGPCGTHARGTRIPNRTHAARRPGSCYYRDMQMWRMSRRDGVAMLAGLVAPLALAALLIPFRGSFPNTDAALALILVVVAVAANGYRRVGYLDGINAAAQAAASGASPPALIDQVASQLTRVLSLESCRFQYGAAGLGRPARMQHDGTVIAAGRPWDVDAEGFPPGTNTELLVEGGGVFQGRFLLTPGPGARATLEQRLLAVALADQVGAALATSHPVGQE